MGLDPRAREAGTTCKREPGKRKESEKGSSMKKDRDDHQAVQARRSEEALNEIGSPDDVSR